MTEAAPQLIFFSKLPTADLAGLYRQPGLIDLLVERGYGIALALPDWSAERAAIVRLLTERGVPVSAWLVLPEDAGYWFNVENYPQAMAYYQAFRQWVVAEDVRFAAVGLDMEAPPQQRAQLRAADPLSLPGALIAARRNALFPAAYEAYHDLVAQIRSDGYAVHTYQYPFVVDDRRAATTLVQRTLNVVAVPVDLEVLLCYSSRLPRSLGGMAAGGALIAEYGLYADSIGIGVVEQRASVAAAQTPDSQLSWPAFARDLRIAARYTDTIHVLSLEGCVDAGYIERLADFDWVGNESLSVRSLLAMRTLRFGIGSGLWWSRNGLTLLGWLGWVVVAIIMIRQLIQRLRRPSNA